MASGGVRRGEFGPTTGAGRGLRPGRPRGCGAVGPRGRGRAKAHNRPGRGRGKDEAGLTSARSQEVTASSLHSAARRRLPLLRSRAARTGSGSGRLSEEGRSLADGASAHARGGAYIRARREGRGLKEISGVSGDPGDFVRKGRGCFSSGEEKRPHKAQNLIFIGKTQNKQPTPHLQAWGRRAGDLHPPPICTQQNPPGEGAPACEG